ncbi:hypothetical protein SDC9_04035 [bioreactor metagenome]|uniref:DUF3566 domain-containing protein n=1 Tax=bioreactor metagenome TaxID=1076179 RepID=A0A644SXS2_9ZZZZ|nr:hypothetical protein [Negativicutes bacterium]
MFNYTITRLPYVPVAGILFAAGICFGGLGGVVLGAIAHDTVGLLGGLFLGLVCGITAAVFGLVLTAVFNVLAPYIGGLPVKLDIMTPPEAPCDPSAINDGSA